MQFRFAIYVSLIIAFFISSASAQIGELKGRILLKQSDGSSAPLEGALIDIFRTDIAGKYETRTNKNGEFTYAAVPYRGVYILAVSARKARPLAIYGVQAGRGKEYEITLNQGDGRRLTFEEAQIAAIAPESILADEGADKIANRAFTAGNSALVARRYEEAIKYYDEAITAMPNQPALWTNKSIALKSRAIDNYNSALSSSDEQTKRDKMMVARNDWQAAYDAATKAGESVIIQPLPTEEAALRIYKQRKYFALLARFESLRLIVMHVDASLADEGWAALQEYVNAETDPEKRNKARLDAAQMLLEAKVFDKALEEYRRILAVDSENIDAMLGLGLALYRRGNKSEMQEAASYLKRFVEKAPLIHPLKTLGVETLEKLKSSNTGN
jgi:tetratricopeptide (TPR) repeat protein